MKKVINEIRPERVPKKIKSQFINKSNSVILFFCMVEVGFERQPRTIKARDISKIK